MDDEVAVLKKEFGLKGELGTEGLEGGGSGDCFESGGGDEREVEIVPEGGDNFLSRAGGAGGASVTERNEAETDGGGLERGAFEEGCEGFRLERGGGRRAGGDCLQGLLCGEAGDEKAKREGERKRGAEEHGGALFEGKFKVTEGVLDAVEVVLEDFGVGVDVVVVAKRAVEDTPCAVIFDPRDAEVLIAALDTFDFFGGFFGVETEEHCELGGVVGRFELVDFFFEFEGLALEVGDEGVIFSSRFDLDADGAAVVPGVTVKVRTDHGSVFGPSVEGVGGGVNADEAGAVFDVGGEITFEAVGDLGGCFFLVVVEEFELLG